MDRDHLPPADVELRVRQAGGVERVARALRVPRDVVVRWHFEGIDDAELAVALTDLWFGHERSPGRPRNAQLVTCEDLERFVDSFETQGAAAGHLGITPRALRRYCSGCRGASYAVAVAVRRRLAQVARKAQEQAA